MESLFAMLARDAHVARRNFVALLFQRFAAPDVCLHLRPRHGRSGYMPPPTRACLLPGIMAILHGGHRHLGCCLPLIAEFQFTREIEDRLLAPMNLLGWPLRKSSPARSKRWLLASWSFPPRGCSSAGLDSSSHPCSLRCGVARGALLPRLVASRSAAACSRPTSA